MDSSDVSLAIRRARRNNAKSREALGRSGKAEAFRDEMNDVKT